MPIWRGAAICPAEAAPFQRGAGTCHRLHRIRDRRRCAVPSRGPRRHAGAGVRRIVPVGLSRAECLTRALKYDWLANNSRTDEGLAFFFDQARLWRSRALVANPEAEPETWYGLGVAAAERGSFDLAIEAYTRTIAFAPTNFDTYLRRGNAYVALGQLGHRHEPETGESASLRRSRHDDQPSCYAHAVRDYSKAIELDPTSAIAHNHRGAAYAAMGEEIRAIADFSKAIDLDPDYAAAYRNRSRSYACIGAQNESEADAAKARSLWLFPPRAFPQSHKP